MALPFLDKFKDNVSTAQRPEAKSNQGWVFGTVMWSYYGAPTEHLREMIIYGNSTLLFLTDSIVVIL